MNTKYNARWTMLPPLPPEVEDMIDLRGYILRESKSSPQEVIEAITPLLKYWQKHSHGHKVEYQVVVVPIK